MERNITTATHDVLVVGAGPAGLTAAITLARHGVDVLVVEKHAGTSPFPKATGVSTRTMELLRSWGLEEPVRAGAIEVQPVFSVSETLAGPAQATVPFGYPTEEQALAVSPVAPGCVPQDHLEPVLRDHLLERGGTIRFGTELIDLSMDPTGAWAELREIASDRRYRVRSAYVIGADGPRSPLRSALGVDVEDLGSIGDFVSITFRADLTRRLPRAPSAVNAVETSGAQGLFVPTSADDRWIYARVWRPETGDTLADLTPGRITELLRAGTGLVDLSPQILSVMPFGMGGHVATTFRAGRAFLVGDAAHRTTPVGGTGMNTAIHGAHNLGWKLAWVLRGWAGDELLDSYEAERRPIGLANVRRSLQRGPQPPADGLSWDIGVRYESAVVTEGPGAGLRAPHAWVRHHDSRISTLDLFDGRLTLLTGPQGEAWHRAATDLAVDGLPIVALTAEKDLREEPPADKGALTRRYQLGMTGAALIRPDGYVAWSCSSVTDDAEGELRSAVDAALGRASGGQVRQVA